MAAGTLWSDGLGAFAWVTAITIAMLAVLAWYMVELPPVGPLSRKKVVGTTLGLLICAAALAIFPYYRYVYIPTASTIVRVDRLTGQVCPFPLQSCPLAPKDPAMSYDPKTRRWAYCQIKTAKPKRPTTGLFSRSERSAA